VVIPLAEESASVSKREVETGGAVADVVEKGILQPPTD
jgi:hypothetical protein